ATRGWGRPAQDEADIACQLGELTADPPDKSSFRVLVFVHRQPVAVAGCTIAGPVARLWGAVTLPAWRGRGAYRAVLAERLRLASDLGAHPAQTWLHRLRRGAPLPPPPGPGAGVGVLAASRTCGTVSAGVTGRASPHPHPRPRRPAGRRLLRHPVGRC